MMKLWMVGANARITDESKTNKSDFKEELKFVHPKTGEKIFCPYHGKIKTPQYRIHFQWPLPEKAQQLFIGYFGPKITKS
jgi:hypothetical protein